MHNLAISTIDNEVQQHNVSELRIIVSDRINYLQKVLESADKTMIKVQQLKEGKTLMDKAERKISNMDNEEDQLLKVRMTALNNAAIITPFFSIVLIISSLIILFASYFKIMQELHLSDQLKLSIENSKKELEISHQSLFDKNTELEMVNRELLEQKHFSETILDTTPDLIGAYDQEMKIIGFNKACEDLFNLKKEDIIGKPYLDVFPNAKNGQNHQNLIRGLRGETIHNTTYQSIANGRYFENRVIPLKDQSGNVYAVIVIAHDNTEVILTSERISNANKELNEKNTELQKINKELEVFAYISSHDLQEPLRQIQIFASRINEMEQHNLSEKGKDYFERMNGAAKRMQTLITDLLTYSRTKTSERNFKVINLNEMVNEVIEEFSEIIRERKATFEIDELGESNVIPFQFRQMLHNLIGSALKFSQPDTPPHIIIKHSLVKSFDVTDIPLLPESAYYHLSITDNGIGFESQYKDRIFEVFQRLHDKQKIAGTGIGLAIVKKIVENHNGFISTKSELNKGAAFHIYIPITQNQ